MAKPIELARVHGAAYHFAFISRDKAEIATQLGVSERTIHRYAKMDAWHQALDVFGYTGERAFVKQVTRDASRDNPDYQRAKSKYRGAYLSCVSNHELASHVEYFTGISAKRVREWAKQHNWHDEFFNEVMERMK